MIRVFQLPRKIRSGIFLVNVCKDAEIVIALSIIADMNLVFGGLTKSHMPLVDAHKMRFAY